MDLTPPTTGSISAVGTGIGAAVLIVGLGAPSAAAAASAPTPTARSESPVQVIESGRLAGLRYYVVQPGDTLAGVADRTGVPAERIREANGMRGTMLYAGYRLLLDPPNPGRPRPGPGATTAGTNDDRPTTVTYRVRAGDTLSSIAQRFDTTVAVIRWINSIEDPHLIRIGSSYVIPPGYRVAAGVTRGTNVSMSCPVSGASHTYDWGNPRGHGERFHEGIDLMAPTGAPVRAITDGIVEAGTSPTSGKWVALVGDDGWQYFGAHLDRVLATGRVRAGDVIGTVGTTGNAAGGPSHLHLEIRPVDGRPTNPLPLIRSIC